MNERMSGNPSSQTNPSVEVQSNNHPTSWPNCLNAAYALMFFNDMAVKELMSPKYEQLIRNAFNLYLHCLPHMGRVPAYAGMTFTNYVLTSLARVGFFMPHERATAEEIDSRAGFFMPHERATAEEIEGWRAMYRHFITESYTMRPLLAALAPNSALQLEGAFALQSAVVLRSALEPLPRFGSPQLQFPIHPGHLLSPSFPLLPQSSPQLPLPSVPSPLPPLPHLTPVRPPPATTDWSIQNLLSLNHTIKDEFPAAESRPELPASPSTHRSADSPSDCFIESAPEHFKPFPLRSFQQLTDRSYEPVPATSSNSTPARSYEPLTSRSFQPTVAPSFKSAGENSVGASKMSRNDRSNERTGVGTLDPPPKRSYEPPVTRSNQSSARSTERSPARSLESTTPPKYQTYPAPHFRPSIGSGYCQPSASGFVPPTAGGVGHDTSSGYQQSATHSFLSPPTTSTELLTTFKSEASLTSSEPTISSAIKSPTTPSFERSTLRSAYLPGRCSGAPPPAHIPMKWPIPDHSPTPLPLHTIKPPSTPLLPPTSKPPPTPSPIPQPLLMPPPLPMPLPLPMPPPLPMPVYSQAHMPILRANQVQMAAPPLEYMHLPRPEHIPLPPRRSRRETTGCPLCRNNNHT